MKQHPHIHSCPPIEPGQEHLTPEQETFACQFAQERIAALLSTAPVDEAEAEELLKQALWVVGTTSAPRIRWFDSPLSFMMAQTKEDGSRIRIISGWDDDSYTEYLRGLPHVYDCLTSEIWGCVAFTVEEAMPRPWRALQDRMRRQKRVELARDVIYYSVAAYDEAHWLAYYWFLHEHLATNDVIFLARLNEMVSGYGSTVEGEEIWLTRKPTGIERDEQGRLHSSTGMCMQYRDGWGFYAWHGVAVPEELILSPEYLIKADWVQEKKLDVRQAFQKCLGSERFVELVEGVCLDRGSHGILIEITLEQEPERVAHYVQVKEPATPHPVFLRVPPSIMRVDEAVAWMIGNGGLEYGQKLSSRF
jgi:hypothetical protein